VANLPMSTEPYVTHRGEAKVRLTIGTVSIALDLDDARGMAQGLDLAAKQAESMAIAKAEASA
jgi:hypothetical protein